MAFSLKTWVNRISEYPNRRKLTHEDGKHGTCDRSASRGTDLSRGKCIFCGGDE